MANKILILAESGSGKTFSLRTLNPKETFIVNADQKSLSFKGWRANYKQLVDDKGNFNLAESNLYSSKDPDVVTKLIKAISEKRPDIKTVVVDTLSLLMVHDFMSKAKITGFAKFTDMALAVYNLIDCVDNLREDLTVVFTAHIDKNDKGETDILIPGGKVCYLTHLIDWKPLRVYYTPYISNEYSIVKESRIGQSAAKLPVLGRMFNDYRVSEYI